MNYVVACCHRILQQFVLPLVDGYLERPGNRDVRYDTEIPIYILSIKNVDINMIAVDTYPYIEGNKIEWTVV